MPEHHPDQTEPTGPANAAVRLIQAARTGRSPPDHDLELRIDRGRTLTYSMLERLGRAIIVGRYDAEPFPTEAEIAKMHGVSRSVTREALKMLAAKGLLSARPRQGTTVRPDRDWNLFDPDVLRWLLERKFSLGLLLQFNQLRVGIEPEAAALAAVMHGAEELAAIERGLARMADAERGHDEPLEADIAFHVAVLHASGNQFYMQFDTVVATALRTSIRFTNRIKGRSASIEDHEAVVAAIRLRDGEGARLAMRGIIDDVLDLIASDERGLPSA
jgi:DNA-binding FadR family transcriptional regulator